MSRGSRLAGVVVWLCLVPAVLLGTGGAAVAANGDNPPDWCFRMNSQGEPSTCTWDGTRWHRSFDGSLGGPTAGPGGAGAAIGMLVVLGLLGSLGFTVWKVSTARRLARDSGMSTGDATAMALLTDDGFEATYLASNLRGRPGTAAPVPPPAGAVRPFAERLRELAELRDQGVITDEEHDRRRSEILDSL